MSDSKIPPAPERRPTTVLPPPNDVLETRGLYGAAARLAVREDLPTPTLPLNGRRERAAREGRDGSDLSDRGIMPTPPPALPVIGVDAGGGNSTGVVILGPDLKVRFKGTLNPGCQGPKRLSMTYDMLDTLVREHGPFAVAMREGYAIGATNRPYLMGEIGGAVQIALYPYSARLLECAPKALKKFLTGNGSATKVDMMESLKRRGWLHTKDDDIADAYALARLAACCAGYAVTDERPALEVLSAIVKGKSGGEKTPRARRMPGVSKYEIE